MDKLVRWPPLGEQAPLVAHGLTARRLAPSTLIELRGNGAYVAAHLADVLPNAPNRSLDHGSWRALWLRPGGWLLIAEPGSPAPAETFASGVAQGECRLTDVSDAWAGISLGGSEARNILAKGTPLDLRPSRFAPGQCARTWCAGFTVLLDCREDAIDIRIEASMARGLWDWLEDAAQEFVVRPRQGASS